LKGTRHDRHLATGILTVDGHPVVRDGIGGPAATAHVVGLSTPAIVAGEQTSVLPGASLTLSAPPLSKIERGGPLAGL
jgi:hypothetical protein